MNDTKTLTSNLRFSSLWPTSVLSIYITGDAASGRTVSWSVDNLIQLIYF